MDRLASEGVTFKRAYVQYAYCSPSRNSFLSGRRPDTTQVWNFVNNFRDVGPHWASLPGYFRQNGFITLGSGKLYHPGHPGDNDYAGSWSPEWPYFSPECQPPDCPHAQPLPKKKFPNCLQREPPNSEADDGNKKGKMTVCVADIAANESRLEDQLEDMQIRDSCIKQLEIAKKTGKNFFIGCGFHKPHVPWVVPAEFWRYFPEDLDDIPLAKFPYMPAGMPEIAYHYPADVHGFENLAHNGTCNRTRSRIYRRAYYAAVAYTDYNIGKVLDAVEELGLKDDTAVLVFGDHGWQLGEHDTWAKMTNFELAVRIPMIIRAPWISGGVGTVTDVLAEAVDFYPTLAELAGLPDPKEMGEEVNGTSLVPAMRDPGATGIKTAAYSQFGKRSLSNPYDISPQFTKEETEAMGYSVRVDNWRYTAWFRVPKGTMKPDLTDVLARELYSHAGDDGDFDFSGEDANVVDEPARKHTVARLHRMIEAYVQIWPMSSSAESPVIYA
eukprot:CAMPEP_0178375700 /NCGR_PEP_ID=MMETSP0689_2-20121128/3024_1 /TAXON_ID=160604 /ORGANISM="Amphidinium massartii, Strain CS-259" /LENGTH=496 /DNA_ID=CAMNT_0019995703 /DNA_START=155 /DNA_END=1645 /DNA_ORIENTATION=+